MYKTFVKNIRSYKDASGNRIFRVSNYTGDVEYANGDKLPQTDLQLFAENSVDNAENLGDNTDRKINDYLTITKDGAFKAKLFNEVPLNDEETSQERIKRRENEVANMDKELNLTENPDAYAQLLNDKSIKDIENHRHTLGDSWTRTLGHYRRMYQEILENNNKRITEKRIVEQLYALKGAIRYAERQGIITRGNQFNVARTPERIAGVDGKAGQGMGRKAETETGNRITDTSHSENNQGGFHYEYFHNLKNNALKFSISNNDNSTTSFKQKVRNKLNEIGKGETPSYQKRRNQLLSKLSGYKIAIGGVKKGSEVVIDDLQKVIRVRSSDNWNALLPAVGTKIAKHLNISETEEMSNYIADWLMTGAMNNNSAEAKEFQRAMRENPKYAEILMATQLEFKSDNDMDSLEYLRRNVSFTTSKLPLGDRIFNFGSKLYTQYIEALNPVDNLVKAVSEKTGVRIKDALNPYVRFRLCRGSVGKAMAMIEGDNITDALKKHFPNVNSDNFKTIREIFQMANIKTNDKKAREDFSIYCIAVYQKDLWQVNKDIDNQIAALQNGVEDLEEALSNAETKTERKSINKQIGEAETQIKELQEKRFNGLWDEKRIDDVIEENKARFDEAQKALVNYSRTLLAIYKDAGMISEKKFQELIAEHENYVPMFRVFDENEELRFGDSFKKMRGSDRLTVDAIESVMNNTIKFMQRAEKNKAKLSLLNLARCGGVGELVEEVPTWTKNVGNIVYCYENGKKIAMQTDSSVVKAINSFDDVTQSNYLLRMLHAIMGFVRASFTMSNPDFAIGNLFRDSQDAAIYSKHGFIPIVDTIRGLLSFWGYDTSKGIGRGFEHALDGFYYKKDFWDWQMSGASQSSFVSSDIDYAKRTIDEMTKSTKQRFKEHPLDMTIEMLQKISEWTEYATRVGEYNLAKQKLAKDKGLQQAEFGDLITAALSSRDLMDFARHGKAGHTLNSLSAFSNAALQGADKFVRTFKDGTTKERTHACVRVLLMGILPAVLLTLKNRDEDWYKELQDYEKNTNWFIAEGLKIPKGMDFGVRLGSALVESLLDKGTFNSSRLVKNITDSLPEWKPTAIMPIIEASANYSFFMERPIVPTNQQKLSPKQQFGSNTTELAKKLGELFDYSPRKIDHLLTGYLGSFFGRQMPNFVASLVTDKKFDTSVSSLPILRRIFFDSFTNPKTITDYYKLKERQEQLHNDYKLTGKKPEEFDSALYKRIQSASKAMQNYSKQERMITDNTKLSVDERKARLTEIQKKKIELIKRLTKNSN